MLKVLLEIGKQNMCVDFFKWYHIASYILLFEINYVNDLVEKGLYSKIVIESIEDMILGGHAAWPNSFAITAALTATI